MAEEIEGLEKAQDFYSKYKKAIIGSAIGLVAGVGIFAFLTNKAKNDEIAAQEAIAKAEQYFAVDSFNVALNGDANSEGFLAIYEQYGNTTIGKTAGFYAGVAYAKMGKFAEALPYLEEFNSESEVLMAKKYETLAFIYAEQNKVEEAKQAYLAAATATKVPAFAAYYNTLAADYFFHLKDYPKALELYKLVKTEYPNTDEGRMVDKWIALTETKI